MWIFISQALEFFFFFFKLRRECCDQAVSALILVEGDSSGYSGKDGFVKGKVEASRALSQ